jgi:hypothetical protein
MAHKVADACFFAIPARNLLPNRLTGAIRFGI